MKEEKKGLMLRLKAQYFGHLMGRVNSLDKTLMLAKTEGKMRRGQQRMTVRWYYRVNGMNLSKLWDTVRDRVTWCAAVHGVRVRHDLATEQQQRGKRLDSLW